MRRPAWLAALMVTLAAQTAAWAQAPRGSDAVPVITTPEQLRWSSVAGMPGLSEAWLVGQSGTPGLYVVRRHFQQGGQVPPRANPQTIFLTVLSGDVYFGSDSQINPGTARRLPAGTFLVVPGGSRHYLWARYGEAVVQEWGTLPAEPASKK